MKERGSSAGILDEPADNSGGGVSILDVPAHASKTNTRTASWR